MNSCKPLDFSESTSADFDEIVNEFHDTGQIYTMSVDQLVKNFMGKALCLNFFKGDLNMRDEYIKTSWEEDKSVIPVEERAFCFYILKRYFGYVDEPKTKLLNAYERAVMHIADIDDRLSAIQDEIKILSANSKSQESQEKLPVLYYYQESNKNAREDIVDFMKNKIKDYALNSNMDGVWQLFTFTYGYNWNPKAYAVKYPKIISNKFLDLPMQEYNAIPEMYENDRAKFDVFLADYLDKNSVVDTIRCYQDSYVVGKRWGLIQEMLSSYEAGFKAVFASTCLQIIEGIFHDICLLLGIREDDISGAGFKAKLDALVKIDRLDIDYEYYCFRLRFLRNQVAHGVADAAELQDVSGLLLLDLLDVIKLSNSSKIYSNAKRFFLHEATYNMSSHNYMYAVGYVILSKYEIPDFYNIGAQHDKLMLLLREDSFWDYVDSLAQNDDNDKAVGYELLKWIKNLKDKDLDEKCKPRFKLFSDRSKTFELEDFLKEMMQYAYY